MDDRLRRRLVAAWSEQHEGIPRSPPASESELAAFEARFGTIPPDFRWFLQAYGGGVIGSEWIDDVHALARTHEKFAAELGPPRGWRMKDVFVIGWDKAGNPFGIHVETGKVLVEDHDFGGIHEMAASFAALLEAGLVYASRLD